MTQLPYLTPLPVEELRRLGVPAPWSFGFCDRVRFGELDVIGHVNNASYLAWFENFRIQYFRDYGIATYDGHTPRIVLRNIGLEFLSEVLMNQTYVVVGRTTTFRNTSFVMEYAVVINETITTKGSAVIVNLSADGEKQPLPPAWTNAFLARDGAERA